MSYTVVVTVKVQQNRSCVLTASGTFEKLPPVLFSSFTLYAHQTIYTINM